MHGGDAPQGEVVVHHGEHTLLHLAAVPGVDNNLLPAGDVEHGSGLGMEAQLLVVFHLGLGGVINHEVRLEAFQLRLGGTDEHILHKVGLPGHLHDEADGHAGIGVGAAEGIHHKEPLAGKLLDGDVLYHTPGLFGGGVVVVLVLVGGPPDGVLGVLVHDDELILGGAAGVDAGHDVDGPQLAKLAPLKAGEVLLQLLLEKHFKGGIVDDLCGAGDAVLGQIDLFHDFSTSPGLYFGLRSGKLRSFAEIKFIILHFFQKGYR